MRSILFASACVSAIAAGQYITYPPLAAEFDGQAQTLYVQYPEYWSEASTSGSTVTFDWNNRMYLSTSATLDTTSYFKPNLVGGSLEFDVDLSQSGCGCLTALYAIVMPRTDNSSDPFQYCDGASVGGYACPEFDMMEANKYAFRSTAHKCDKSGSTYSNCDRNGTCSTDVLTDKPLGVFEPGSLTGIDTEREFHIKQEFHEADGLFTGYTTTMSQDGADKVVLSQTNCSEYLSQMTADMSQMVISLSNWSSSSFDWLQHGVCSGYCSQTNTFSTLKNLKFFSGDYSGTDSNTDGGSGGNGGNDPVWTTYATLQQIRDTPHYSSSSYSRTLYQIDRELDLISAKMTELITVATDNNLF